MDVIGEFVHLLTRDAVVVTIAAIFGAGVLIAPIVILVRGAGWWKRRLKWAAVAMLTSWFGLWLFWRDRPRASGSSTSDGPWI